MEERLGEMRKGRRERIEKGSHCFFKSSGYDKLELNRKNLVFSSLREDKKLIRRERRDGGEGEERGLRKGAERG